MTASIDLLYCPPDMDPALVVDAHTAETWDFEPGSMTIESNTPAIEPPLPDDPAFWRDAVIETLQADPIGAHLVDPDDLGSTILLDDHGIGFAVHHEGNGVNVFVADPFADQPFAALWQAMQIVAERHSCIAYWFDESRHVDLDLPTGEAREAYFIV